MVEHKRRRRRRKVVEEEITEEVGRRKRFRATKPVAPKSPVYPPHTRQLWFIANLLFKAHPDFAKHTHKVYQEFRELFCLAYADQTHTQTGENAEVIKVWTGKEVITNWLEGTKAVRKKEVKKLREELAQHLEYLV